MNEASQEHQARATMAALLVAPLAAAVGLLVVGGVKSGVAQAEWALVLFFPYYLCAVVVEVVLGLPAFLLLRRFGAFRWWSATLAGVVAGILVFVVMSFGDPVLFGGIGGLSAFVFWGVWHQGARQRATHAA